MWHCICTKCNYCFVKLCFILWVCEYLLKTICTLCAWVLSHFSCVWLFATPWTVSHKAPLSMGFSRQEYQSALPCPPPGIKPVFLGLLHWQAGSLSLVPPRKPMWRMFLTKDCGQNIWKSYAILCLWFCPIVLRYEWICPNQVCCS